ncbi:MATE family efflux transporter [Kocuria rosea subsp. polaris]|uniref:MATE family efflux transporter n=1 Tax=Kocuria rosea subsp. polaris TaxID=136273 RepID=A0A0W8IBJ0_KOCRO|nr:MATE family efflux transporter [Kocuria polaris]KUG57315.1 MATE family efflux transporter [Kocuria polaris]
MTTTSRPRGLNRQILALAVPAFGALVAEPLFLLADSAIVGHLGTPQLAGVGVAAAVLQTVVGLMVFLAYSTTPAVARHLGAGRLHEAVAVGRDGLWVAAGLGLLLSAAGWAAGRPLLALMGARGEVLEHAVVYLHWSLPGLTAMLLVLAATGVLRGLQDTRTPLLIAGIGAAANAGLNLLLVHGAGLGVAGAAIGTSAVQWAMALAYLRILRRLAREHGVGASTTWPRLRSHLAVGSWLMLRTVSLRVAILATVLVVTGQGAQNLAAHQLVMTVFNFLAFALDALAIAAQALLGRDMGARDVGDPSQRRAVRALMDRLVLWGLGFGVLTGLLVALVGTRLGFLLSPDPAVQALFAAGLLVVAVGQPLAAYVFVLDGVLIGAGDARYLAVAGVLNLAVYAPLLVLVALRAGSGTGGFVWLWAAYAGGYLGARALTLGLRARGDSWLLRNAR